MSKQPTIRDDRSDAARTPDVQKRIRVEENQVGELAGSDSAGRVEHSEEAGRLQRRSADDLEGCKTPTGQQDELLVQSEAGRAVSQRRVGPGKDPHPGSVHRHDLGEALSEHGMANGVRVRRNAVGHWEDRREVPAQRIGQIVRERIAW